MARLRARNRWANDGQRRNDPCGGLDPSCPVDCGVFDCGAFGSPFDESGCLQPPCSFKLNCPDDGVCVHPEGWGLCVSSGISCSDASGVCECTMDPDCGGRFCMPAGSAPPTQCNLIEEEGACIDAECSTEVFAFPDRYDPPPAGWIACDDLGFSTPECDCAQMLPCAT